MRTLSLFWLLLLVNCLHGQGYEKLQTQTTSSSIVLPRTCIGLPDGSFLFDYSFDEGRISAEGKLLWSAPSISGGNGRSILLDTLGEGLLTKISVINMGGSQNGLAERIRRLDGTSVRDTAYRIWTAERDMAQTQFAESLPNGELLYLASTQDTSQANVNQSGDSLLLFKLDAERRITHRAAYKFGEAHRLMGAFSLPDGSVAAVIQVDTLVDGMLNGFDPVVPVHLHLDGTYTFLDIPSSSWIQDIGWTSNGGFKGVLATRLSPPQLILSRYDFQGDSLIRRHAYGEDDRRTRVRELIRLPSGGFGVAEEGLYDRPPFDERFIVLRKIDADFNQVFVGSYGLDFTPVVPYVLSENTLEGLTCLGRPLGGGNLAKTMFVINTDANGGTFPHLLSGRLTAAAEDCTPGEAAPGLPNWWLKVMPRTPGRDTLFAYTQEDGFFAMRIDTGAYDLVPVAPNAYWEACPPLTFTVGATASQDTITVAPTAREVYDCGLLRVGITSAYFLNRCEETNYTVTYENQGTTPTEPSLLRVLTDPDFTPTRSFPAWDQQIGDTLFYNLAPVLVGEGGQVSIFGELGCEATPAGQTHCTEAKVFPDSLCTPPGINWDGSSLEVTGRCEADTVIFEIRNVSDFDMTSPTQYIITEDVVLHLGGEVELRSNTAQTIRIPAQGATYQMIAQQPEGHPGSSVPTVAVEGCGADRDEDASRGFIGQYPNDDGDPFIAIDCRANNGEGPTGLLGASAGAGNKVLTESRPLICTVIPSGIGEAHYVDAGIPLRYRLSFLNPTTDTLHRLVITDTLSSAHDLTTVALGPATHPYQFEQTPYGVLRFLFDSIVLPPGGQGVVSFSVAQAPGNQVGTLIRNRGGISYQAKGYQSSNTTELRLRKEQRYGFLRDSSCRTDFANLPDFLRQRDTTTSLRFDSVGLRLTLPLPAYALTVDTILRAGDSLLGFQLLRDTVIIDELRAKSGCDSTITFRVNIDPGTSIKWPSASPGELHVYPNPVRDMLLVQAKEPLTMAELVDAVGRVYPLQLRHGNQGAFAADLRQLPAGVYFLRVRQGNRTQVTRVVKAP